MFAASADPVGGLAARDGAEARAAMTEAARSCAPPPRCTASTPVSVLGVPVGR